jgi:hypothetical protein
MDISAFITLVQEQTGVDFLGVVEHRNSLLKPQDTSSSRFCLTTIKLRHENEGGGLQSTSHQMMLSNDVNLTEAWSSKNKAMAPL